MPFILILNSFSSSLTLFLLYIIFFFRLYLYLIKKGMEYKRKTVKIVEFVLKAVKLVGSENTNFSYLKIQLHPRFETTYAILACAWDTFVSFGACLFGTCFSNFRYRILGTRLRPNSFRGQNYDSATGAVTLISFTTSLSLYFLFLWSHSQPNFLKIFILLLACVRDGWW